jgi:hypothetical protein
VTHAAAPRPAPWQDEFNNIRCRSRIHLRRDVGVLWRSASPVKQRCAASDCSLGAQPAACPTLPCTDLPPIRDIAGSLTRGRRVTAAPMAGHRPASTRASLRPGARRAALPPPAPPARLGSGRRAPPAGCAAAAATAAAADARHARNGRAPRRARPRLPCRRQRRGGRQHEAMHAAGAAAELAPKGRGRRRGSACANPASLSEAGPGRRRPTEVSGGRLRGANAR